MQSDPLTSVELLARFRAGDDGAATDLFQRYAARLTALARSRLSARLARRTDPEDVVMSAWRSFFVAARAGRFAVRRNGDLWRLLVEITLHKLYRQARRHTAEKRSVGLESSFKNVDACRAADTLATPEEALALAEELEAVLSGLDAFERRVLELRLQGEQLEAIATETGRSERTVRRTLVLLRQRLARRWEQTAND